MIIKAIDWNFWKDNISTEGLVDKVKVNYNEIAKQEYQVEPISKAVINSQSKELEEIVNKLEIMICFLNKFLFSLIKKLLLIGKRTQFPRRCLDECLC